MKESNIRTFHYYFDTASGELKPITILSGDDENGYECVYKGDKDSDSILIDKQDMVIIHLNVDTMEIYTSSMFDFVDDLRTAVLEKEMNISTLKKYLKKDNRGVVDIIRMAARDNPIEISYHNKDILKALKTLGFKYVARYQTYKWAAFHELPILYVDTYVETGDREGLELTNFDPNINFAKEREVYLIEDLLKEKYPLPIKMDDFSLDDLEDDDSWT